MEKKTAAWVYVSVCRGPPDGGVWSPVEPERKTGLEEPDGVQALGNIWSQRGRVGTDLIQHLMTAASKKATASADPF